MKSTFSPLLLSSCLSLIIPHISASGTVQLDLTRKRGDVVDANGIRRREVEAVDAPLTEPQNFIGYAANITIGTPPQDFEIHLDTGSGDLWVVAKDAVLVNVASADTSGFPATYCKAPLPSFFFFIILILYCMNFMSFSKSVLIFDFFANSRLSGVLDFQ